MNYIVIEIQTNSDGTIGNIVTAFQDRNHAEQQYHSILSAAAVSNLPSHAAVLLTNEGIPVEHACYNHSQG